MHSGAALSRMDQPAGTQRGDHVDLVWFRVGLAASALAWDSVMAAQTRYIAGGIFASLVGRACGVLRGVRRCG
ncbi:hypothetical protein [Mycobacterium sp.]|uniref:hypothetical protein n=1 Tax=Mycobacterium sp. TaxID=1785 RepID=UPI003BAA5C2F